jgi:hypothetical protein
VCLHHCYITYASFDSNGSAELCLPSRCNTATWTMLRRTKVQTPYRHNLPTLCCLQPLTSMAIWHTGRPWPPWQQASPNPGSRDSIPRHLRTLDRLRPMWLIINRLQAPQHPVNTVSEAQCSWTTSHMCPDLTPIPMGRLDSVQDRMEVATRWMVDFLTLLS